MKRLRLYGLSLVWRSIQVFKSVDQVKCYRFHGYMAYLLYGEAYESLRGLIQENALDFTVIWLISYMKNHMSL